MKKKYIILVILWIVMIIVGIIIKKNLFRIGFFLIGAILTSIINNYMSDEKFKKGKK